MQLIQFLFDWLRRLRPTWSNELTHVTSFTKELNVSLERMYENAIDGAHLPHLHQSSFSELTVIDEGTWGWRARGHLAPKSPFNGMLLELRLDRDKHRWITKTLSGLGAGTEIWTHAIPLGDRKIKVIVDFYIPKLPKFLHSMYAQRLIDTYAQLYLEDEAMMQHRQAELDRKKGAKKPNSATLDLGLAQEVTAKLPLSFELGDQRFQLIMVNHTLIAHSATCPHQLGPLDELPVDTQNGVIECPWHGYRFSVHTGKCISGAKCQLTPNANVAICKDSGHVIVSTAH
mgnify:CR=1 FL=1